MLNETGLGAPENWTFGDGFVERLRYEIDPQWRGEIPRTILITRDGAQPLSRGLPTWTTFAPGLMVLGIALRTCTPRRCTSSGRRVSTSCTRFCVTIKILRMQ